METPTQHLIRSFDKNTIAPSVCESPRMRCEETAAFVAPLRFAFTFRVHTFRELHRFDRAVFSVLNDESKSAGDGLEMDECAFVSFVFFHATNKPRLNVICLKVVFAQTANVSA